MTSRTFRLRLQAERDLTDLVGYFADVHVELADAFIDAVRERLDRLVRNPLIGTPVAVESALLTSLRRIRVSRRFKQYLIFYVPDERGVDVLRVLHGARDLPWLYENWR